MFKKYEKFFRLMENFFYNFFYRLVNALGQLIVVSIWLADYLGPEQNGKLNFAFTMISLFTPIATMGLNEIVIRELVRTGKDNIVLGSTFVIKAVSASICFFAINFFNFIFVKDPITSKCILILSFGFLIQITDFIVYWFQAKMKMKHAAVLMPFVALIIAGIRIYMIASNFPIDIIVYSFLAEYFLVISINIIIYKFLDSEISKWKPNFETLNHYRLEAGRFGLAAEAA